MRDETLQRYPQVADGASFFFVDLPETYHRNVVWSYGIDSAVRIWYNNPTLRARKDLTFGVTAAPSAKDLVVDFSGRWQDAP